MSTPRAILHPGASGADVAALHQALAERGLLPPEAGPEEAEHLYGAITAGAIQTFQAKHGLTPDEVVGPRTWAALEGAADAQEAAPAPAYGEMTALGASALQVADEMLHAGVAEVPLGSNRGPKVDTILRGLAGDGAGLLHFQRRVPCAGDHWQGAPWCGRSARYCIDEGARRIGLPSPLEGWGDLASAAKWMREAHARGKLLAAPVPGCVGLILIPQRVVGAEPHGHVILTAGRDGDAVWTREGNSANRFAARRRPTATISAWVTVG